MKIGIISDVHGNVYGLRAVLAKLAKTDIILCAGDLTGYYPFVNEVFREFEKYQIRFILGNHDAYLLGQVLPPKNTIFRESLEMTAKRITYRNLELLKKANQKMDLTIGPKKIVVFHGSPRDPLGEYVYPEHPDWQMFDEVYADIIILGHTHIPMIKKYKDKIIINPGSCGQPRDYDPRAAYAIYDLASGMARIGRAKYDRRPIAEEVIKEKLSPELINILNRTKKGN